MSDPSELLPPGDFPAPPLDPREFLAYFGEDFWPALFPKLMRSYPNTAARDADLAGLGPTERAFAFIEDKAWLTRWTGTTWRPTHPVSGTASLTFAAGVATLNHGLGFVPNTLFVAAKLSTGLVHLAWSSTVAATTTTAQIRCWDSAAAPYVGTLSAVEWMAT